MRIMETKFAVGSWQSAAGSWQSAVGSLKFEAWRLVVKKVWWLPWKRA
jgi:hypothetical protein